MKYIKLLLTLLILTLSLNTKGGVDVLFDYNDVWKYVSDGTCFNTSQWRSKYPTYNDQMWLSGPSPLGYLGSNNFGTDAYDTLKIATVFTPYNKTYYLRKNFVISDINYYTGYNLKFIRNNGIVIYINGTQVYKDNNLPETVTCNTLANSRNNAYTEITLPISKNLITNGFNTIAIELHNFESGTVTENSNVWFQGKLLGTNTSSVPTLTRGPYMVCPYTNIKFNTNTFRSFNTIQWRTDIPCRGRVAVSTSPLLTNPNILDETTAVTDHSLLIGNLIPYTKYYYSVGYVDNTGANVTQYDSTKNFFYTPPPSIGNQSWSTTRFWITGDVGFVSSSTPGGSIQDGMKSAFLNYCLANNLNNAANPIHAWIWLGDNAYSDGTDIEYQSQTFNPLRDELSYLPLLPSPGNHDYYSAPNRRYPCDFLVNGVSVCDSVPYYKIFSIPEQHQGILAGTTKTERYWSQDYGMVHFISLDSYGEQTQSTNLNTRMLTWLQSDLQSVVNDTNVKFIVAFWHHPPYTKGTHNSETSSTLSEMRNNVLPILEKYGVDLVLCGHSHIYERSKFVKGHFKYENILPSDPRSSAVGKNNPATGRELDFKPYRETTNNNTTVYGPYPNSNEVQMVNNTPPSNMYYIKGFPRITNTPVTMNGTVYVVTGNASQTNNITQSRTYTIGPHEIIRKSLTNGVATLTINTTSSFAPSVGTRITVSGVDATFNGNYVLTAKSSSSPYTVSYAKPNVGNVTSTSVSPSGTLTSEEGWPHNVMEYSFNGQYPGTPTGRVSGGSCLMTVNRVLYAGGVYYRLNLKHIQYKGNGTSVGNNNYDVTDEFTIEKGRNVY